MNNITLKYATFKKWIILMAMVFSLNNSFAGCDMCSLYMGLHPNQVKNGISLKYRHSLYETSSAHVHNGVVHSTNPQTRTFQTIEAWAQLNLSRKMQVVVMLPFSMNSVEEKGLIMDAYNYIGDVQGLFRYQIYKTESKNEVVSRVVIGVGLKAPTGRYNINSNSGYLDQHIQTGTGSWDLIYNTGYLLKYKKISFNEEILYRMNTENNLNYRFADRFSSNSTLYYTMGNETISIIPSLGYLLEFAKEDLLNDQAVTNTNGTSHYMVTGVDSYYKNLNFNLNFQKAFVENLRDTQTSNTYRFIVGLGVNF